MPPVLKKKGGDPPAVAPSLREVLSELAIRREKLDALDTQVSAIIRSTEDGLRKHFSTRIALDIGDEVPAGTPYFELLVFGKLDGKWMLFVESGHEDGDNTTVIPLLSCPREVRIEAFTKGRIERLVRSAVKQLDGQIAERDRAIELGTHLVAELNGEVPQW